MITLNEITDKLNVLEETIKEIGKERKMFSQDFQEESDAKEVMKAIIADDRFGCVSHLKVNDIYGELDENDPERYVRWRLTGVINYHQRDYGNE